jgi:nitric oxide reductase NorD protein
VERPLSRFARRLAPAVDRLGRRVGPAARLARIDLSLARAWLKHDDALRQTLGAGAADAYTALVLDSAHHDAMLARSVAHSLPDRLAALGDRDRQRMMRLLRSVCRERPEALTLLLRTLPDLLGRMDDQQLSSWVAQGLALHVESARKAESFLRLESGESQREVEKLRPGLRLEQVRRTLSLYARAHCGEDVQVRPGNGRAFTDGRHVFLPEVVDFFGDERDFDVYRVLTARNVGYLEFGTLDLDLDSIDGPWPERRPGELDVERLVRSFPNSSLARDIFFVLEDVRVEGRVREEYPGVARDMDALADAWLPARPDVSGLAPAEQAVEWLAQVARNQPPPRLADPAATLAAQRAAAALERVRGSGATVADTVAALQQAYVPVDALLRRVDEDSLQRLDERQGDRSGGGRRGERGDADREPVNPGEVNPQPYEEEAGDSDEYRPLPPDALGSAVDTRAMAPEERDVEEQARQLLAALQTEDGETTLAEARRRARQAAQSYEEMADFLDRNQGPAGPSAPAPAEGGDEPEAAPPLVGASLERDAVATGRVFLYPEWDAVIGDHKPDWVRVTEYNLEPGSGDFVRQVREEHGPLIARVRRAFEALRPDAARRVRGLADGDEIDLDLAIQSAIERRAGGSPSERIYARRLRQERDVAVAFLVDMSSSTNEVVNADNKRVIEVEKEALVLICEAVDAIGDRAAIWGFSGYGRDQVAFYIAKEFDTPFDERVRERIGRISWKMENRDGAAIRHAAARLAKERARVKLLILLSDGKPLDCGCDHYADRYAQEDTRAALAEARRQGVHPFCITVDPSGPAYLGAMYGEGGYTVIDRVERLPERLPLVYRRLTR